MHYIIPVNMLPRNKFTFLGIFLGLVLATTLYPSITGKSAFSNFFDVITSDTEHREITVLFVGDMMFDRGVRNTTSKKGFDTVFGQSKDIFKNANADIVVGNLEGPITSYPSKIILPDGSTTDELNFTFPAGTAKALKEHGFNIVSLANNHTANQGADGLAQTKKYLSEAGIAFFGSPFNKASELSTTTCQNDICISLIGWHEFANTPYTDISKEIKRLRPISDIIVVFSHWGVEYQQRPTIRQREIAHAWIDAGADLTVGAHPHVIQSVEEYKGKKIFYSLGNFIFDQYFSFNTTHGLAIALTATKETTTNSTSQSSPISTSTLSIEYKLYPTRNVGTVVSIPNATTSEKILKNLTEISQI